MGNSDLWELVYTSNQLYLAEMIKDILIDHEVEAVVVNKQDSFYHFGDIEVYVRPSGVVKAKHIINKINEEQ